MNISKAAGPIVAFPDLGPSPSDFASSRMGGAEWVDYCRGREQRERNAAKSASSAEARRIHQELAQTYARLIRQGSGDPA